MTLVHVALLVLRLVHLAYLIAISGWCHLFQVEFVKGWVGAVIAWHLVPTCVMHSC
jgi:hypothetical protein